MQTETTFTGFADRAEGGRRLAQDLQRFRGRPETIVLAVTPGGAMTAAAVAEELDLPIDMLEGGSPVRRKTVILVDDGVTPDSVLAATIDRLRARGAGAIVLAVPVAALDSLLRFENRVDGVIYVETPDPFRSVDEWYVDFEEVTEAEAAAAVARVRERVPALA